mmetsp:Transcript_88201/g.262962  ORF Transcript_88201/g.262962 Transcript_88201/m.262962 type:complete len:221 (-) Transcript_88201:848-1510(-)
MRRLGSSKDAERCGGLLGPASLHVRDEPLRVALDLGEELLEPLHVLVEDALASAQPAELGGLSGRRGVLDLRLSAGDRRGVRIPCGTVPPSDGGALREHLRAGHLRRGLHGGGCAQGVRHTPLPARAAAHAEAEAPAPAPVTEQAALLVGPLQGLGQLRRVRRAGQHGEARGLHEVCSLLSRGQLDDARRGGVEELGLGRQVRGGVGSSAGGCIWTALPA